MRSSTRVGWRRRAPAGGFSLLELMVVVSVVGLLLGVALPKFNRLRDVMSVEQATTLVAGELRRARAEAVKRNRPVTLTVTGSSYSIALASAPTSPLFTGFIPGGVTVLATGPVTFRPFGPPTAVATISLSRPSVPGTRQVVVETGGAILVR